ncbi:MAG: DUF2934 domain-containing protein [Verrucomicrobiota bacterium]
MNKSEDSKEQYQKSVSASPQTAVMDLKPSETYFVPSSDEVARRAYFCYVNDGAQPGHDVQHWLAAESELIAERNRTRIHGFHNRT